MWRRRRKEDLLLPPRSMEDWTKKKQRDGRWKIALRHHKPKWPQPSGSGYGHKRGPACPIWLRQANRRQDRQTNRHLLPTHCKHPWSVARGNPDMRMEAEMISPSMSLRPFIHSFIHPFTLSSTAYIHPFTRSSIHSFIHLSAHSFMHQFMLVIHFRALFIQWVICIRSFMPSRPIHSFNSLTFFQELQCGFICPICALSLFRDPLCPFFRMSNIQGQSRCFVSALKLLTFTAPSPLPSLCLSAHLLLQETRIGPMNPLYVCLLCTERSDRQLGGTP